MLWLMKTTARPRSRASMTNFSTIAAWCTPSAEVGSSRISTLRAEVDGAGDGHRLPLAAGERADRLGRVAHVDADVGHRLAGDGVGALLVEAAEGEAAGERLAAEEEVPA